jgi:Ca2+-binding RTX toxin-like protein
VDTSTGGAGNDTFNAVISDTAATSDTLTTSDTISGGAGTDSLNLTVTGTNAAVAVPIATISGVETINVRALQTTAATITTIGAANYTGVTAVNADRASSAVTITGLATGASTGVIGNANVTNGALVAGYSATATGAATLNVSGGTVGTSAITLTGGALTSTVVNSTGATANEIGAVATPATSTSLTINAAAGLSGSFTTGAETAITVTGAAATGVALTTANNGVQPAVVIGTPVTTVKTVDASAMTAGGVGLTVVAAMTSFKGGQGTDRVTTAAITSTTASIIDAGAGTDTLVVAATADVDTAAEAAKYAGFEVLDVGAQTANMSLFTKSAITNVKVGGNATLSNLTAAQAANIDVYASASGTFGVKDATDVGQIDTLKLNVSDNIATSNTITLADIAASGVENIAVNAVDKVTISALTGATAATNFTFTGGAATSVTTGALALNANSAVDATALTGTFTFNAAAGTGNGLRITGSATKVDTITGSAQADIITGGSAADVLKGLTGNDVIVGGAGADAISGNRGADKMTGGDGADTFTIRPSDSYAYATTGTAGVLTITPVASDANGVISFTYTINGTAISGTAGTAGTTATNIVISDAIRAAIIANPEVASYVTLNATGQTTVTLTAAAGQALNVVTTSIATAGAGSAPTGATTFTTNTSASSGVLTTDTITDLDLGGVDTASGVDKINLSGISATALTVVAAGTITGADLSAAVNALFNAGGALNGTTNAVGLFTYGTDTYLIGNVGAVSAAGNFGTAGTAISSTATLENASDFIVKVTGVTGTLDASDFTFV